MSICTMPHPTLIRSTDCILPHLHLYVVVDGVGVVVDGSDGSDVGPLPTVDTCAVKLHPHVIHMQLIQPVSIHMLAYSFTRACRVCQ